MINDQTRVFFGILLCVLFYYSYTKYLQNKYPDLNRSKASEAVSNNVAPDQKSENDAPTNSIQTVESKFDNLAIQLPAEELTIKTEKVIYSFDQHTSALKSVQLQEYFEKDPASKEKKQPMIKRELLEGSFVIQGHTSATSSINPAKNFSAKRISANQLEFWRVEDNWEIKQQFIFNETGYGLDLKVSFKNVSSQPKTLLANVLVNESILPPSAGGGFFFPTGLYDPWQWRTFASKIDDDVSRHDLEKLCQNSHANPEDRVVQQAKLAKIDFAGLEGRYFAKLLRPKAKSIDLMFYKSELSQNSKICDLNLVFTMDHGSIAPGGTAELDFVGYFGPKDLDIIARSSDNMVDAVNLGWIGFIAKPLMKALHWINKFVGNYGIAIIIATILLKILFYPLTKQAAVSAHQMKLLQPYMKEVQEKFKDDRQQMQMELMKLYREHKVNPAKSCLPILPTIPVFLAFYQVLMYAIDLRQAPFFGWIQDLSQRDPTYITPVALGVLMIFQMRMTPAVGLDKTQQNIMMLMPIVFTFAMLSLPAGLVVYMIANTVLTMIQQKIINMKLN